MKSQFIYSSLLAFLMILSSCLQKENNKFVHYYANVDKSDSLKDKFRFLHLALMESRDWEDSMRVYRKRYMIAMDVQSYDIALDKLNDWNNFDNSEEMRFWYPYHKSRIEFHRNNFVLARTSLIESKKFNCDSLGCIIEPTLIDSLIKKCSILSNDSKKSNVSKEH